MDTDGREEDGVLDRMRGKMGCRMGDKVKTPGGE
jgi:hypothetical protein